MKQIECEDRHTSKIITQMAVLYHDFGDGFKVAVSYYYDDYFDDAITEPIIWLKYKNDKYFKAPCLRECFWMLQNREKNDLKVFQRVKELMSKYYEANLCTTR